MNRRPMQSDRHRWWVFATLVACGGARAQVPPAAVLPAASGSAVRRAVAPSPAGAEPGARVPVDRPPAVPVVDGCPSDMVPVGSFCIDRYEAPNQKGELPYALQTAYDGESWCAARDKQLCTDEQWVRACTGPHGRKFPYGETYRPGICNDDHPWIDVDWKKLARWPLEPALEEAARLYQADMSGARAECVTEEGAFDMTGNVAEWVRKSAPPERPGYEHVLKGCYWSACYHDPQPSCAFANRAHPGTFRTYEAGFRCCKAREAASRAPSP